MLSQLLSTLSRLKSPAKSAQESSKPSASAVSSPRPLQESLNNSFLTEASRQIKADEGCVLYAYDDHLGYTTIGYGRLLDKRRGGGISQTEAEYLLENDIDRKLAELRKNLKWFDNLDDPRKGVLLNMCFQLGIAGLLNFKNTLAKIEAGDYEGAADNMLKSKWARQTPLRAERMAEQMRTGRWLSGNR
jgi:lysozyme